VLEWVLLQKPREAPGNQTNVPGALVLAVSPEGAAWLQYDDPATDVRYRWRGRTADPLALDYVASFETLLEGRPAPEEDQGDFLSLVLGGKTVVVGREVRGPKVPGRGAIHPLIPVLSGGMLLPDVHATLPRYVECDSEEALLPEGFPADSLAPCDVIEITHEIAPSETATVRVTDAGVFVVLIESFPGFGTRERLEPIADASVKRVLDEQLRATGAPLFCPPAQRIFAPGASPMRLVAQRGSRSMVLDIDKFRARDMPRWSTLIRTLEDLTESPSRRL
jgi:hypothetical protein